MLDAPAFHHLHELVDDQRAVPTHPAHLVLACLDGNSVLVDLLGVPEQHVAQPAVGRRVTTQRSGTCQRLSRDRTVRQDLGHGLGAEARRPQAAQVQQEGSRRCVAAPAGLVRRHHVDVAVNRHDAGKNHLAQPRGPDVRDRRRDHLPILLAAPLAVGCRSGNSPRRRSRPAHGAGEIGKIGFLGGAQHGAARGQPYLPLRDDQMQERAVTREVSKPVQQVAELEPGPPVGTPSLDGEGGEDPGDSSEGILSGRRHPPRLPFPVPDLVPIQDDLRQRAGGA